MTYIVAQLALIVAATVIDRPPTPLVQDALFPGVASGQLAALGMWLGAGVAPLRVRLPVVLAGAAAVCGLLALRPDFNGWVALLITVRLPLSAYAFHWVRRSRRVALSRRGAPYEASLLQLNLKQAFAATFGVALLLAVMRSLETYGEQFFRLLLILFVLMVGVAGGLASIVAALAALASRPSWKSAGAAAFVIALLAALMPLVTYSQTSSWVSTRPWLLWPLFESATVVLSVVGLRRIGYRLTSVA